MIIGIDASRAFIRNRTGIEEYSYQVIKHLIPILKNDQVILYIKRNQESRIRSREFIIPDSWSIKTIKWNYLWTQLGLSIELLINPIDVLFIPAHVVPCIHPKNTIVTVHGLEYEFCPKAYSFLAKLYMRWSIKKSCQWAKKIIAVSDNTKRDLMKLYKVPETKMEVIHEGVSQNQNLSLKVQDSNVKCKVEKPYLLFIGRLEERKNIVGIIRAFKLLKEKYKIPHKLVLAGNFGYGEERIIEEIKNVNYANDILIPGYISEEEKWKLLKDADVFLFPTFYEGFGLPVLEAQSVGVPVVAGNNSSITEVANESALIVNPNSPEEIANSAHKLISDKILRDDIISRGYNNVKRFNWEKCAQEISKLINYEAK
jgi:glycosyltransferase involved in cell wall biosynthesis